MADVWTVYQGQDASIPVTLKDGLGNVVTTYTGSEALSLQIWTGDDQAPQAMPSSSVTWVTPAAGTITIKLAGSDVGNLAAQPWRGLVWLTSTVHVPPYEFLLIVLPVAGSATAPPIYATYDDMRKCAQFLDRLITSDPTQMSSMGEYLGAARQWLDRQILSRARSAFESQYERHWPAVDITPPDYSQGGPDTGPDWGASVYPQPDVDAALLIVKGYLDAGGLDLTDGMARRLCARYAVAELCASQVGTGPGDTSYQVLSAKYRLEATKGLLGFTARIATNAVNGTPTTLVL